MGSLKYIEGEIKERPGLYSRYSNADNGISIAGAINGVGAIVINATWGPLATVTKFTGSNMSAEFTAAYGTEGNGVKTAQAFMSGGLSTLYVYRAGTGGTAPTITLDEAITLTTKNVGTRSFSVTIRDSISDAGKKEMLLLEGATVREKYVITSTAQDLADAITTSRSSYLKATVLDGKGSTALTNVSQSAMSEGTAPTVTAEDYSNGFTALEPYNYNVITIDTHKSEIQTLLANYAAKADEVGKRIIVAIGSYNDMAFETRCTKAKSFNAANICYSGSGYYDKDSEAIGKTENDCRANAIMAGYIASVSSKGSVIHQQISGATDVIERLSNTDYTTAIKSGLLLLSVGSDGQVWFDSGVNTLTTPSIEQDEGWKKIKRVKIRYELFDRIDRSLEPYIGKVNADTIGLGTVQQVGQKVIDIMVQEGKLISGTMTLSTSSPDSCWFDIAVIDPDTLEKIYLHYLFRYSQETA